MTTHQTHLIKVHLDPGGFLQVFLHPSLEQQSFNNLQVPDEEQVPAEARAPPAEDGEEGLEILDGRTQRLQRFWDGFKSRDRMICIDLLHVTTK